MTDEIILSEIEWAASIESPEIQKRAEASSKSKNTIHYLARRNGQEIAFVSLDQLWDLKKLILYELYVPRPLRRRGIGGALLKAVERFAIEQSFRAIRVSPSPIDSDISVQFLTEWYQRNGYGIDPSVPSEMEKCLLKGNGKKT